MKLTLIWLLIATTGSHTSPTVIARFNDAVECQRAADQMQVLAKDKSGMANLYGVCIGVNSTKLLAP